MQRFRYIVAHAAGFSLLVLLVALSIQQQFWPSMRFVFVFVWFGLLFVAAGALGIPLGGGYVSLLPMTAMATLLVVGTLPAGWIAWLGEMVFGWIRWRFADQLEDIGEKSGREALRLALTNAAIQPASILVAGFIYQSLGGQIPLESIDTGDWVALLAAVLAYLGVNILMIAAYMFLQGRQALVYYLRSISNLLVYEGAPTLLAPLMALIFTRLGSGWLIIFSLTLVMTSLFARRLALARQRLERRVKELDSLQVVGQALSASLQLDHILFAIYEQVARLMPANVFYIALYNPENDEVSFPISVDEGSRVQWRSRRAGNGLTEYLLHTKQPLLIPSEVEARVRSLGIDFVGKPAQCWLGVPILSGDTALGVITVQSYSETGVYDVSSQEILVTIAAQAALAIQNARLYARTDEALAGRVRELDSILRTTSEGILLLSLDWQILAVNQALATMFQVERSDLLDRNLISRLPEAGGLLVEQVGYSQEALQEDCELLRQGVAETRKGIFQLPGVRPGNPERIFERTLTPVRARQAEVNGWLMVFRDITEERELERLKDDLLHTIVHDLRSPLGTVLISLKLLQDGFQAGDTRDHAELIGMAQRSGDKILRLVDQILEVNRLERGGIEIQKKPAYVKVLLQETAAQLATQAAEAQIRLQVNLPEDLPVVNLDEDLIGRVVYNLLDNAIKFTKNWGIVKLWARLESSADKQRLVIGVTDTGPGIPAQDQVSLFNKFQRAGATQGRRRGSGLGLYFCRLAIEAHAGEIGLESQVGRGSTFWISLPLDPQA